MSAALLLAAALELLAPPQFGDPTTQDVSRRTAWGDVGTVYFGDEGATNYTLLCWMLWEPATNRWVNPMVQVLASADPARATSEGGAALSNCCYHAWSRPLPLSGGTWAETCLPAEYDHPPEISGWENGCYTVNIETDEDVTLTVAGAEKSVSASNGVMQVFNILGETSSRAVAVSTTPGATVRLGVAQNPLVQFVGAQCDMSSSHNTTSLNDIYGGLSSNEWRMVVARGAITNGVMVIDVCEYNAMSRLQNSETSSQALWHPRSTFAKNARIRVMIGSLASVNTLGPTSHVPCFDHFQIYGLRAYRGWFSDAEVERMRDLDVAELSRRGLQP